MGRTRLEFLYHRRMELRAKADYKNDRYSRFARADRNMQRLLQKYPDADRVQKLAEDIHKAHERYRMESHDLRNALNDVNEEIFRLEVREK